MNAHHSSKDINEAKQGAKCRLYGSQVDYNSGYSEGKLNMEQLSKLG